LVVFAGVAAVLSGVFDVAALVAFTALTTGGVLVA